MKENGNIHIAGLVGSPIRVPNCVLLWRIITALDCLTTTIRACGAGKCREKTHYQRCYNCNRMWVYVRPSVCATVCRSGRVNYLLSRLRCKRCADVTTVRMFPDSFASRNIVHAQKPRALVFISAAARRRQASCFLATKSPPNTMPDKIIGSQLRHRTQCAVPWCICVVRHYAWCASNTHARRNTQTLTINCYHARDTLICKQLFSSYNGVDGGGGWKAALPTAIGSFVQLDDWTYARSLVCLFFILTRLGMLSIHTVYELSSIVD